MSATIGGGYGALLAAKEKKAQQKANKGANPQTSKPKAAKVLSLKDTKDRPEPKQTKPVRDQSKNKEQPKPKEPERELSRREAKAERETKDHHVPRQGHQPSNGPKVDKVQEEVEATKPVSEKVDERKREIDEREAERKRKEEEEAKKISFADYQKSIEQKKAELNMKTSERKVDTKAYSKLAEMKNKEDGEFTLMKLNLEEKVATKAPAKKDTKKGKEVEKAAPKNSKKFVKNSAVELGFFAAKAPQAAPRGFRGNRNQDRPKPAAEPAAPVAEAPAAEPVATETPAADEGDQW